LNGKTSAGAVRRDKTGQGLLRGRPLSRQADLQGGIDQTDMAEGLGKISEEFPRFGIDLFRYEPEGA